MENCGLTPDHEVMTFDGWIPIDQITTDHLIYSMSSGYYEIGYCQPYAIKKYEIDEIMFTIDWQEISLKVTENYKLWTKFNKKEDYRLEPINNIIDKSIYFDRTAKMEDFINVRNSYLAPGIPFSVNKIMDFTDWYVNIDQFNYNKKIDSNFKQYLLDLNMNDNDKKFPDWIWSLPTKYAFEIIEMIIEAPNKSFPNIETINEIQRLSIHAGNPIGIFGNIMRYIMPYDKINCKKYAQLIHYQGPVYDITIPGNVFMIRRNGVPLWI